MGAEAGGELRMTDAGGWRHVRDVQDHGHFIEKDFSGTPVFDAAAAAARHGVRKLLGMVVATDRAAVVLHNSERAAVDADELSAGVATAGAVLELNLWMG